MHAVARGRKKLATSPGATRTELSADDVELIREAVSRATTILATVLRSLTLGDRAALEPLRSEAAKANHFGGMAPAPFAPPPDGGFPRSMSYTQKDVGAVLDPISGRFKRVQRMPAILERPKSAAATPGPIPLDELKDGELRVLTAIAQHAGASRDDLSVLTGYKPTQRDSIVRTLIMRGDVEEKKRRTFVTDAGRATLEKHPPLVIPRGAELLRWWLLRLPANEARMLEQLVNVYPSSRDRAWIGEATGYRPTQRDELVRSLVSRRIVVENKRRSVASPWLFGEGAT